MAFFDCSKMAGAQDFYGCLGPEALGKHFL